MTSTVLTILHFKKNEYLTAAIKFSIQIYINGGESQRDFTRRLRNNFHEEQMDILKDVTLNAVQIIQLMLAPAVMISACGLLLLGINNKYSIVVNRIRLLNEERRNLLLKADEKTLPTEINVRLESISKQLHYLSVRIKIVRNTVLSYVMAVGLFVLTSLLIGVSSFLTIEKLNFVITATFLAGMISVFVGAVFAGIEIKKGYEIVIFEIESHE